MKLYILASLTALALAPTVSARAQTIFTSTTVPLKYLDARSVPALVKTTQDIDQLVCNIKTNSITLIGSQNAVHALAAEILKADVETPVYLVKMRLVRYQVDKKGKVSETVVMEPNLTDADSHTGSLSLSGPSGAYSVLVTPKYNDAKTVTLTVEVRELGDQQEILRSGKNTRQVTLGEKVRITGMTDATDKAVRRAVQQGEIVTKAGPYTGYYLEATPTALSSGAPAKP